MLKLHDDVKTNPSMDMEGMANFIKFMYLLMDGSRVIRPKHVMRKTRYKVNDMIDENHKEDINTLLNIMKL